MNFSDLLNSFDSYNREARLYPAAIVLLPIGWTVVVLWPQLIFAEFARGGIAILFGLSIIFLLASVARWRGKLLEPRLIQSWGGWPTTVLLRHADNTIDPYTKRRYHARLQEICPGLEFPSPLDESSSPDVADQVYRSATKRLLEFNRERDARLVKLENASYGFRRNLYAMKAAGIAIIAVSVLSVATHLWASDIVFPDSLGQFKGQLVIYWREMFVLLLNSSAIFAWVAIVRESFVKYAAQEFAEALFRTLDVEDQ